MRHRAARRSIAERSNQGYSLIELLMVVVVLGVLASIVTIGVAPFRQDAAAAACATDLGVVRSAANAFDVQQDTPLTSMAQLVDAGYLKDFPVGTTRDTNGDFQFASSASSTTVTKPC